MSPIILGSSGIGKQSPTMARRKNQRRVNKDQLATAVRKNFNALPVNENDVIVALMYKTRNQGQYSRTTIATSTY
jgi:histone deacetylase complex subunit SAP30